MRAVLMSRNGLLGLCVLIAVGAGLALLSAIVTQRLSTRTAAASLLVMCFVVFNFGGFLFAGRAFLNWQIDETSSHLIWERGFVMAAVVATVLGLALLEDLLRGAGDFAMARIGTVAYLFGAAVLIVAETAYVGKRDWIYPQIVFYVITAFLAQAAFGAALLQTGLLAAWVGIITIMWNLGWLLVMLVIRPRDIYYPVLHHVAPLIIGIALLVR